MEKLPNTSSLLNKQQTRKFHKIIRRVHLYLGLTLIPWLLLYGVTALLFNHGMWMTNREDLPIPSSDPILVSAQSAAQDVATQLKEQGLELVPNSAQWIGSITLKGTMEGSSVRIRVDPEGQGGLMVTRPDDSPQPEWTNTFENWLVVDEQQEAQITDNIHQMIQEIKPDVTSVSLSRYPKLRFQVHKNSEVFTVDVRHNSGISVEQTEAPQTVRTRMLRLHTMHGDPGYTGAKWLWVKIVDIMGIAMIIWGLSGIIMWWTIRPTRRQGAIAITDGISLLAVLSATLWNIYGY